MCYHGSHVNISDNVKLHKNLFKNWVNFTSVVLLTNTIKIPCNCFENCFSLKTIKLPKSVTKLSEFSFYGCVSLTSILCNTNVILGRKCFSMCDNLVSIPQTKYICNSVFERCSSLSKIILFDGLANIPHCAFFRCYKLSEISVPNSVTHISKFAFKNCISLTSFNSESVLLVEDGCFMNCAKLNTVCFNQKKVQIKFDVFSGCTSLQEIRIGNAPITCCEFEVSFTTSKYFYEKIGVVCNNVVLTRRDVHAFVPSILNEKCIQRVDEGCFFNNRSSTKLVFPSHIKSVGYYSCFSCANLKEVVLPEGITEIPAHMFDLCTSLSSIAIPTTVTKIGTNCFFSCDLLRDNSMIPKEAFNIGIAKNLDSDDLESDFESDSNSNYSN
ncbi:hypothetical protein EIN_139450 [Entamoeba invadens IP1]|uniref:Leucine rich repeat containing protein BspA family protein n=1 Tax=Entamoeba invadens IP1 TaxID=370355 RepID=A0A0A1TV06_ENTIV|nr:hypothetical protein EIN_139450 [Entamoeba invadens IP1]ELP84128.1 hypothetical protein EIN_139450 [Entamoeba invadens IP1]|eukprot:XP_004183474.1 hypothetical protein EIN_139450 [Entamoeba invadens IP1]